MNIEKDCCCFGGGGRCLFEMKSIEQKMLSKCIFSGVGLYLNNKRKCSRESIASMEQFRHDFPTLEDIFQHVLHMYQEQNARYEMV